MDWLRENSSARRRPDRAKDESEFLRHAISQVLSSPDSANLIAANLVSASGPHRCQLVDLAHRDDLGRANRRRSTHRVDPADRGCRCGTQNAQRLTGVQGDGRDQRDGGWVCLLSSCPNLTGAAGFVNFLQARERQKADPLLVKIEAKFRGMGSEPQRLNLSSSFFIDPDFQNLRGEDVIAE